MATPNVGDDPINPAYYAGTAYAEIIEHMPTNVGFAAKYAWRLGEKDDEKQEIGKAIWYLKRELIRDRHTEGLSGGWFYHHVHDRLSAASESGKLCFEQCEIISACTDYCISGSFGHLERAIILFEQYMEKPDANHE